MHETSLALAVLDRIEERAQRDGRTGARSIALRIGELAGVVPEVLEFCFAHACAGTLAEGAELTVETVTARARCSGCPAEWPVGVPPDLCCPDCDAPAAELLSGRELEIAAVEWTDPAVPADSADPAGPADPADSADSQQWAEQTDPVLTGKEPDPCAV